MKFIKKSILALLCFTLVFTLGFQKETHAVSNEDYKIITNDNDKLVIETEIDGIKGLIKVDKETLDMSVQTNEKSEDVGQLGKEYKLEVENVTTEEVEATVTDIETEEKFTVSSSKVADPSRAAAAFAIPIGVAITQQLLRALAASGLVIAIGGSTYIAYKEFAKRSKSKTHYVAIRRTGGLFIGNGMDTTRAITHLQGGGDTWSTSQSNAQSLAKMASMIGKAVGPEIDANGSGKHYHYHPVSYLKQGKSVRMNCHAFYGGPR
jgi:hypothetical protein